ncbi:hypothetical protein Poli38472_008243 [Pythium oligandrum]|uniref:Cytochrome P450 n=1 Tax=Pythium oligandrum TaxID=41045 RepID=A0A8K1CL28_PYTOL|nr:hypothetical protein Poli38472_008243 [Pythium oligandrum]|eukprot:TMW65601.1 hypothetical protein Poli38472_008243 [Pythium oligandrum]
MNILSQLEEPNVSLLAGTALAVLAVGGLTMRSTKSKNAPAKPRKIHKPLTTLPILGNSLDAIRTAERFHDWLLEESLRVKHEPWSFKIIGEEETLILTSPEMIEEVTSAQFEKFIKGRYQIDLTSSFFGMGVVSADGERWYHQRKTVVRFFSAKVLDAFMRHSVNKNIHRVYSIMDDTVAKNDSIDLKRMFHDFTVETFAEMGLGVELNCLGAEKVHPFQEGLEAAGKVVSLRFRRPEWAWKLQSWLNFGEEAVLTSNMKTVRKWLHEVVAQAVQSCIDKKKSGETTSQVGKSIIELFMDHSEDDLAGLSQEDLAEFVLTLIVGARDTTADALTWFFHLLGKHPEVEKKIREEMATQLGDVVNDKDVYLTTEHTKHLVYMEAALKEAMRMYPPIPFTFREAAEDAVICGDIFIRKGQKVVIPQYTLARSPIHWGPDADQFRPERWIDPETGRVKQESAYKFFNFSAGPRMCAGMSLAYLELRLLTANLLKRYRFEMDPNNDGSYDMAVTLYMHHPLMAKPIPLQ